MIKFFRHIRQRLLSENKFSKYMLYAAGEIVLVVIGILIALSINNWNEARKQKEVSNTIYQIVKEDLENDFVKIDSFLTHYEDLRKPAFEAVLKTTLTKEDLIQNPNYLSVLRGFPDFAINQRGFELIKNQARLSIDVEKNLASRINEFYNQHIVEIRLAVDEMSSDYRENNKNIKSYDWFSDYMLNRKVNDGLIDYLLNDPKAKNRITLYYLLMNVYASELAIFKTNATDLISQIDEHSLINK